MNLLDELIGFSSLHFQHLLIQVFLHFYVPVVSLSVFYNMFLFQAAVQMAVGGRQRKIFNNIRGGPGPWFGLTVQPKTTDHREHQALY